MEMPASISLESRLSDTISPSYKRLRLAILETDPELVTVCGTFADLFKRLFANSTTEAEEQTEKVILDIATFNVVNGSYPEPDDFDGILVTGSRATAFDNDPWILKLVEYIMHVHDSSSARLVGICFGHQVIARAFGGVVEENSAGWEVSVTKLRLDEEGQGAKLFPEAGPEGELRLQQMHRDHVAVPPPGMHVFATSERSPVQGLYKEGKVLTLQGHPEFNEEVARSSVELRIVSGSLSEAEGNDALARVSIQNHGADVGKAVVRFLVGVV
ncbi:class I glutamine amidotransferase-like protein [Lipomyces chichibuensis]|uniref:class I glutamine amidotransferase-like protein n=1 Tax=Lipomyces chichibuensis TaxID=1546026 RepID=UPI003343E632